MSIEFAIVLLVALVLECITTQTYVFNSFKLKLPHLHFSLITIGFYFVLFLFSLLDNSILNTILFTAANYMIIFFFTPTKPISALFHSLMLTIIMATTEFISLLILNRYTSDFYNGDYFIINHVILMIICKIFFFLVILAISIFNRRKNDNSDLVHTIPIFLLIIPIISITVILALSVIWLGNYSYISNIQVGLLIPIITFLIVVLNIFVFINDYQRRNKYLEMTELQLQLRDENYLRNYYQDLLKEYEDRSILIHDMKNHLQSIMDLNTDNKSIDRYIQDILTTPAFKSTMVRSDNDLLNAIVARYYVKCTAENIAFNTDIRRNVVNFMQNEDITSLFCNLLDNAFEACCGLEDSYIDLHIDNQPDSQCTILKLSNSCITSPISNASSGNKTAFEPIPTTKANKKSHGLGLKSIKATVDKYNGSIKYDYNDEDKLFTISILLMGG